MNDEFIGLEAWFFEELWTCKYKKADMFVPSHVHHLALHVSIKEPGDSVLSVAVPVYSGAGEVPLEPESHSLSPF